MSEESMEGQAALFPLGDETARLQYLLAGRDDELKWCDKELRRSAWKLKLAHKQIGKQGDTIYNLRSNVAELQGLISKEDRGVYRRIQAQYDDLYAEHQQTLQFLSDTEDRLGEQVAKVVELQKKLDEAEQKVEA